MTSLEARELAERSCSPAAAGSCGATVGVLALQGDFAAHARMLRGLGADVREVRVPGDLAGSTALVIPGGESTTMTLGIEREGMRRPAAGLAAAGAPILGTCAGLIMADPEHLGDDGHRPPGATPPGARSAPSRPISIAPGARPAGAGVFIRAPWIAGARRRGGDPRARWRGARVAAREGGGDGHRLPPRAERRHAPARAVRRSLRRRAGVTVVQHEVVAVGVA